MDLKKIKQEVELTRYLYDKASRRKIPLGGTFELTPVCNFSCKMCYIRKTQEEMKQSTQKMLTCEQWIEIAKEMKEQGMLYLLLTGGEPLLYPEFWELYEELSKMGFMISINTNGSLITEDVIRRLQKACPTRVNLTVYGASDETYERLCGVSGMFTKIDRVVTALKEAKIPLRLNCSLTPENVADMEKIINYAAEKELVLSATTYMFPPIRRDAEMIGKNERFTPQEAAYYNLKRYRLQFGEEAYENYLEHLVNGLTDPLGLEDGCMDVGGGKICCKAGSASYWVTWDGRMTLCGMLEQPCEDLTKESAAESFQRLSHKCDHLVLSGVCKECQNRAICQVCAAIAVTETGKYSGIPKYLCEMMVEARRLAAEELEKRKEIRIEQKQKIGEKV